MTRYTASKIHSGTYGSHDTCRIRYLVQPADSSPGVEVSYSGGVDPNTLLCLDAFQQSVDELVQQRVGDGVALVGIDISVEFLGTYSPEQCRIGYAFMYDIVESETERITEYSTGSTS